MVPPFGSTTLPRPCDCFKFRHKIGLHVALEALNDAWHSRKVTMVDLSHVAKINWVERVMRPYLELLAK